MCSARDNVALPTLGFPIRASAGQWLFSASPRLIAAVHALLRLLVPRHPPCALTILTVISGEPRGSPGDTRVIGYCAVFKDRGEASTPAGAELHGRAVAAHSFAGGRRSLKTQQHAGARTRALLAGRPARLGRRSSPGRRASGALDRGLPRKEVIQPQLPLRLPCYDFTPVASPTFDGSLPKGLGHRLRVLLTPMV